MRLKLRRVYKRLSRRSRIRSQGLQLGPPLILALLFLLLTLSGYHLLLRDGSLDYSLAKALLHLGLPSFAASEEYEERFDLNLLLYWLTTFDLSDPVSLIEASLPFSPRVVVHLRIWEDRPFVFIQELSFAPDPVRPQTVPEEAEGRRAEVVPVGAKVLIYHTHTSEMYLGRAVDSGQSRQAHYQFRSTADPTITGVMAVGRHLANALTSLGVEVVHDTRIHTLPSINTAYASSERTVREILNRQKDFNLVIDVHRDAGVPNPTLIIDGREVARVAIVVGTAENTPLSHPDFEKNLDLAHRIKALCDQLYPGLMRPVQVHRGARYNQHLHPASLLFEIGSVENTLEEALLAAELLAKVLIQFL